jgi:hypothetical protein
MRMGEMEIHEYARQLLEAHGEMAVVEAAQKEGLWLRSEGRDGGSRNLETH